RYFSPFNTLDSAFNPYPTIKECPEANADSTRLLNSYVGQPDTALRGIFTHLE
ncbi:hypothetical protein FRC09_002755, partial [Ceratobasidium sp. 395]